MAFEPELVREYKRVSKAEYPTPLPTEPFVPLEPLKKIEVGAKLSGKIRRHLLNPRFKVRGYPLGKNAPIVIRKALLESMSFRIETSEGREQSVPSETARRFDHVRVFDLEATTKASQGRKPTYNWRPVAERTVTDSIIYPRDIDLVNAWRENVLLVTGEKPHPLPDDATARGAITKCRQWNFSKEKGKGRGKKLPG